MDQKQIINLRGLLRSSSSM